MSRRDRQHLLVRLVAGVSTAVVVAAATVLAAAPPATADDPPTVAITSPAPAAFVRGTFTITATASDDVGVTKVIITFNGLGVIDLSAPYAASFDTSLIVDGPVPISARAVDASGSFMEISSSVTVDNTVPTLAVTGPDNVTVSQETPLTWQLSPADSHLAAVTCGVAPVGSSPTLGPCSGGTTSHTVSGLAAGSYTFHARASDYAGNSFDALRVFVVKDSRAPVTSITKKPKKTVTTSARRVKVRFVFSSDEPGSSFRCSLDGVRFAACPTAASFKVKPGKHTLQVVAVDPSGNADATPEYASFKVKKAVTQHR